MVTQRLTRKRKKISQRESSKLIKNEDYCKQICGISIDIYCRDYIWWQQLDIHIICSCARLFLMLFEVSCVLFALMMANWRLSQNLFPNQNANKFCFLFHFKLFFMLLFIMFSFYLPQHAIVPYIILMRHINCHIILPIKMRHLRLHDGSHKRLYWIFLFYSNSSFFVCAVKYNIRFFGCWCCCIRWMNELE